ILYVFSFYGTHQLLHSLPTRRSSDLDQCGFDLRAAQAVTRYAQHVVRAAQNPEVAVFVALRVIAGQVLAAKLGREVTAAITVFIAPHGTDHGGPRAPDDQKPAGTSRKLVAGFVDHYGIDTG